MFKKWLENSITEWYEEGMSEDDIVRKLNILRSVGMAGCYGYIELVQELEKINPQLAAQYSGRSRRGAIMQQIQNRR